MIERRDFRLPVGDDSVQAFVTSPGPQLPGVLFVHGWDSSKDHYEARAQDLARLRCVCLSFDLRGHGADDVRHEQVNRPQNVDDVIAAYDRLASHPSVDPECMAIVGTSYGGYLAAIVSSLRRPRWLALRVPAMYDDADWELPKASLDRERLKQLRGRLSDWQENRALQACSTFEGDALVVGSEHDQMVAPPAVKSFVLAFRSARSMTHRTIPGADHQLSDANHERAYDHLLTTWLEEMLLERVERTSV